MAFQVVYVSLLEITDRISVEINAGENEAIRKAVADYADYIGSQVLATAVSNGAAEGGNEVEDMHITIRIQKQ